MSKAEIIKVGTVVYAVGVFDILHYGHINYLREAKKFGDVLVVGLLTDAGVLEYKMQKPTMYYQERYEVLANIKYVNHIVPQEHVDPTDTLKRIWDNHFGMFPDVLVRADDVELPVPGREYMERHRGRIEIVPYTKGISDTDIKNRIVDRWRVE